MPSLRATAFLSLLALVSGQQAGTLTTETHPSLKLSTCTSSGTCTAQNTKIVLDANWRWLHSTSGSTNCYTGNEWDDTLCPDPTTCATNCALDGADYTGTYGINADGTSLKMTLVTEGPYSTNIGSRVYLMASDTAYYMFKPKNQEFTFDVDVSNLPCGLNGALYLSQMDADGGMAKNPTNKAGAKYGTGYCDAQCPKDMKFINGKANVLDWTSSDSDPNAGTGRYGTCCTEMDIWEANSMGEAFTPHVCDTDGLLMCEGAECGDGDDRYSGVCDKDGCDFSAYRTGAPAFYGKGKTVDTTKKMTVVTQFLTADNTTTGELSEIRRVYIQNGKEIANSKTNIAGMPTYDSITDDFCEDQKTAFGDTDMFTSNGGLAAMGDAFDAGMVLSLSIWDDHAANMLWLDSTYPTDSTKPGAARGDCATTSGVPADVEANTPGASVTFSNLKLGPIGSTY